jgi:T5SS/PEP-CTERM-associated repeat protein
MSNIVAPSSLAGPFKRPYGSIGQSTLFMIGEPGGSLSISGGTSVTAGGLNIGNQTGSTGSLTVPKRPLTNSQSATVGKKGTGTLSVMKDGTVTTLDRACRRHAASARRGALRQRRGSMAKQARRPGMPRNCVNYEEDFYGWTVEQSRLLRSGELSAIDVGNIAEEIESMGRSERRELKSQLVVLVAHLLK